MVLLRTGFEDRAKADVVGHEPFRFLYLPQIVRREAYHFLRPHDAPRLRIGQIVLAQMHPVRVDGECQIAPVVDDEEHVEIGRDPPQGQSFLVTLFHRRPLVPVLEDPRATGDGGC